MAPIREWSLINNKMKHKHHIIPRHAGGTDDPSNLIELSIEDHAEAHKVLYEEYGRWQDKLAWKALSGWLGKEEIIKEKISNKGERNGMYGKVSPMRGKKHTAEAKKKMSEAADHCGDKNSMYGKKHSIETKSLIAEKAPRYGKYNGSSKSVTIRGITYDTIKQAAESTGLTRYMIRTYHLKNEAGV